MSKGKSRMQLKGWRGRRSDEWYENYFKTRHLAKPIKGREATIEVDDYHFEHNHDKEAHTRRDEEEGDTQQALQPGELPSDDDV